MLQNAMQCYEKQHSFAEEEEQEVARDRQRARVKSYLSKVTKKLVEKFRIF